MVNDGGWIQWSNEEGLQKLPFEYKTISDFNKNRKGSKYKNNARKSGLDLRNWVTQSLLQLMLESTMMPRGFVGSYHKGTWNHSKNKRISLFIQ